MRRRPRLRRLFKWGGMATCLLILVVVVVTSRVCVCLAWPGPTVARLPYKHWKVYVNNGGVKVEIWLVDEGPPWGYPHPPMGGSSLGTGRWWPWIWRYDSYQSWRLTADAVKCNFQRIVIPFWLLFLLVLMPTLLLWYPDYRAWRAYPPSHCQKCGYDLTGNESGRCPECGREIVLERQKGLEA
jgi:hypothetical protein